MPCRVWGLGCSCDAPVCRGRGLILWSAVPRQSALPLVSGAASSGWGGVVGVWGRPTRRTRYPVCAQARRGSPQVNCIFGGVSTSPIWHLICCAERPAGLPAAETDCPVLGTPNRALGHTLDSTPPSNRSLTLDPCAQQDPHGASDPAPAPIDRPRRRGLEAVGTVSRQTEFGLVAAPHPRFERRCLDTGPHPCVHDVLHAAFPLAGRAGWRDPPHDAPGGGGGAPGESGDQGRCAVQDDSTHGVASTQD